MAVEPSACETKKGSGNEYILKCLPQLVERKQRERCDSISDGLQKFVIRLWFSKGIPLDMVIATQFLLTLMQIYIPQASACIFLFRVHNSDSHKISQNLSLFDKIFSFSQLHPVIFCSYFTTLSVS
jgi:hypothetical protein